MIATSQGGFCIVSVTSDDVEEFRASWPCNGIPAHSSFRFEFSTRNGDLVNITMHGEHGELLDSADYDGPALLALSHDASNFACSGGHLPQWCKHD